ncbi:MAG TPA: hypothetical protein VGM93_15025 [Acidimicrobiales bacterium]
MFLELGGRRIDLQHRAAVIGVVGPGDSTGFDRDALCTAADRAVHDGAALLEVSGGQSADDGAAAVATLVARGPEPVLCRVADAASARAAIEAGAAAIAFHRGTTVDLAAMGLADSAVAVLVGAADLGAVEQAGVDDRRIMVEVDLPAGLTSRYPTVLSIPSVPDGSSADNADDLVARGSVIGAQAAAIAHGARLLRARDVRAARRVADTMAAILEAGAA